MKDVTVRLGYFMDFGDGEIEIRVDNTGKIVHSATELDDEIITNDLL